MNYSKSFISNVCVCRHRSEHFLFCFSHKTQHFIFFFFCCCSIFFFFCVQNCVFACTCKQSYQKGQREKGENALYCLFALGTELTATQMRLLNTCCFSHHRNCLIFSVCLSVIECVVFVWCAIVNCFVMELFVIHMISFFSTNVSIEFRHFFGRKMGNLFLFSSAC